MILTADRIHLGARPADKEAAIRQAAQLLVDTGAIAPAYADSMLRREQEADTFLGNGIAIPHGQRGDRGLITTTAIAVLQVPDGVGWNGDDRARLVVAIAAQGDEHIAVLRRLTEVLGDAELAQRLATTKDAGLILRSLDPDTPLPEAAPTSAPAAEDRALAIEVEAPRPAGLHARPARSLAMLAKQYRAAIEIRHDGRRADAKSLISLLQLGAGAGARLTIAARGEDAAAALEALRAAIVAGLGEGEEDDAAAPRGPAGPPARGEPAAPPEAGVIAGLPASPGVAIGTLYRHRSEATGFPMTAADPAAERAALDAALLEAREELRRVGAEMTTRIGAKHAAIFAAHEEFLEDPELLAEARAGIAQGASAPAAWQQAAEGRAAALSGLGDALLAARATDLRDVARRVLRRLVGAGDETAAPLPERAVVVAEDLTPSETANLDPGRVVGLATAAGGPTAHTAILARALGIPAIVAAGPALLDIPDGTPVVLDGDRGLLRPDPDKAALAAAEQAIARGRDLAASAKLAAFRPAVTRDGHRVEVAANVRRPEEAAEAVAAGAEGSGLVRSEFLFDDRAAPPSEAEQYDIYRRLAEGFGGLPVVLRTLDAGGDKPLRFVRHPSEANPFLGLRGLRLSLAEPGLFRTQVRAALRAARHGDIRLMLPMVDGLADLRAARAIIEQERSDLRAPPIEVGIMVEVPAAAVMADLLASEADFFSIGTNDLTQYTLAVDRLHPTLGARSDALDPAVLRLIDMTVRAAHMRGRWVGVCGNMAADPVAAPILVGLGVDELSVSIPNVAALKAQVRGIDRFEAERLARIALTCATAAEVRALPAAREMAHAA